MLTPWYVKTFVLRLVLTLHLSLVVLASHVVSVTVRIVPCKMEIKGVINYMLRWMEKLNEIMCTPCMA